MIVTELLLMIATLPRLYSSQPSAFSFAVFYSFFFCVVSTTCNSILTILTLSKIVHICWASLLLFFLTSSFGGKVWALGFVSPRPSNILHQLLVCWSVCGLSRSTNESYFVMSVTEAFKKGEKGLLKEGVYVFASYIFLAANKSFGSWRRASEGPQSNGRWKVSVWKMDIHFQLNFWKDWPSIRPIHLIPFSVLSSFSINSSVVSFLVASP